MSCCTCVTIPATSRSQETPSMPPRRLPCSHDDAIETAVMIRILPLSTCHQNKGCMLTGSPCPVTSLVSRDTATTGAAAVRRGAEAASQTPLMSPSCTDSISVSHLEVGVLAAGRIKRLRTFPGSTSHISICLTTRPVSCAHPYIAC